MAWENATGFGSKINPVILPNNLLSLISDNDVGGSQSLYFSTRDYPTGVVVNTNYNNLPITGNNVYASYESSELMDWEYANWTEGNTILGAGIKVFINGVERYQYSQRWQVSNSIVPSYGFVVNHSLQRAKIVSCSLGTTYFEVEVMTTTNYNDDLYNALMNNPYTPYTWSSVPAISGKNGILSLTTLKEESINDGSPVDDATASAFNNAPNSCSVGGIVSVDLPIVDDNPLTIAVKYNIPELTDSIYSSCKVVAKKNKIPKSKTDGDKIIDVSSTSHACIIAGLEQETKYYVVIFVEDSTGNKAESEPKSITTGKNEGIFKMYIQTNKPIMENPNQFIESISYEKL